MSHVLSRALAAAVIMTATVALLATGPRAHAAACVVMHFDFSASSGGTELSPSTVTVAAGACVTFENDTITSAQFTVGTHYKAIAPAFSTATPNYTATPAGSKQPVTASGTAGTAHGSIVIRPAPRPATSPTPTHSTSRSPAPQRQSPAPAPSQSPASPGPHPVPTASSPSTAAGGSPAPSTPFLAGLPTPTPSASASPGSVVAGPLQPPTDRGAGLPAAVAALAVVATAGGLVRVLLAEPVGAVDDGGHGVGAAL